MLDRARVDFSKHQEAASRDALLSRLTTREAQVLERIVAGRLNKQIADDLGISIKTVEAHRANIMEKLNANTVADLLKIALGAQLQGLTASARSTAPASRAAAARRARRARRPPRAAGRQPGLAVILVGDDPASQVYVSNKVKACDEARHPLAARDLRRRRCRGRSAGAIAALNADPTVHGILVQMPLPEAHRAAAR